MSMIAKPLAFIRRDFANETSYKFQFFLQAAGILFSSLTWFFIAKLFGGSVEGHLAQYGGNYFAFVLIGIAFSNYLSVAMSGLSGSIREAQIMGTLEALLVTQTEVPTIILSSSLYNYLLTSVRVILYLLVGALVFGMDLSNANFSAALFILVLTIISFTSLGIISASFIMVLKRGDPVSQIFSGLSWLIGGVYYPIDVLPAWVQKLSYLLPITHSLHGMRLALLQNASLGTLLPVITALIVFALVTIPLSVLVFRYAIKRAKHNGSLTQY